MSRFVALFRGINVGKVNRIAMADLRKQMELLGYLHVSTLLNSGNAVFSSEDGGIKDHALRIHAAVAKNIGVAAQVIVLEASRFQEIVVENSLHAVSTDPSRLLVAFPKDPERLPVLAKMASTNWSPDFLAIGKHAAYVWCANGILQSKLARCLERQLGGLVTTRNWATVEKIGALLHPNSA
jgi:uncharacterized protein (DUF1697 family)